MRRLPRYMIVAMIVCGIAAFWNGVIGDPPPKGSRPQSVAVSPDGATVLATSTGTGFMAQIRNSVVSYVDVGSPSWGVCILSNTLAVVTRPYASSLTVLTRSSASDPFIVDPTMAPPVPRYCTEVIKSPTAGCVLVANRGMPPVGGEPWQHSVLEVRLADGVTTKVIPVEREPRVLAVSSDGTRLFVGHAQGALGETGFGVVPAGFDKTPRIYDGGSVVMYDLQSPSGTPLYRFPIGSPVRGLAIWPSPAAPAGAQSTSVYRLYASHIGDGSQSEAPGHGGRAIPNVISSILINRTGHVPISRTNAVFRHDPDAVDETQPGVVAANLPAIVHDRLTVRWKEDGPNFTWQLWIANAGSGTVSLVPLNPADGALPVTGTPVNITQAPGEGFEIITGKGPGGRIDNSVTAAANSTNATILYDRIPDASQWHVNVDIEAHRLDPTLSFSANPTDIEFDPTNNGRIWVVTHLDHQLVRIDVPGDGIPTGRVHTNLLDGSDPVIPEERNFFTFGRGFDFRETGAPKVQTQACISCHVDGHIDGKVRHTVELGGGSAGNHRGIVVTDRPVAVPSIFDVGNTEWIFFEGLRTIRDGSLGDPGCNSIYCQDTQIFSDTDLFTNVVQTPPSPIYSGSLSPAQEWGRYYFQKMNCTRCHGGTPPGEFNRTNTPESFQLQARGPLPLSMLNSNNRLLHDPSQSFIADIEGPQSPFGDFPLGPFGDAISFRNMTDVGTRTNDPSLIFVRGVNTPQLAGAWDNGPYFHDGRYPTLEAVLEHTWLKPEDAYRAAPLFTAGGPSLVSPADNAFNSDSIGLLPPGPLPGTVLYQFFTHAPTSEGGRVSVAQWLSTQPSIPSGESATQALLAFLRVVSSQSDLCKEIDVSGFQSPSMGGCTQARLSWNTSSPVQCTVRLYRPGNPTPVYTSALTPESHSHILYVPITGGTQYYASITIDKKTSPPANSPVCAKDAPYVWTSNTFTTASCPPPCRPPNCPEIDNAGLTVVARTALLGTSPNPVISPAQISFSLAEQTAVRIQIFDIQGRMVRTLVDESLPAGIHHVSWDRTSQDGIQVPIGTYHVKMVAGEFKGLSKVMVIR